MHSDRRPTNSCSSSSFPAGRTARTRSRCFMKVLKGLLALLLTLIPLTARAQGKLNVVTATEDLAAIAREVAGDRATIESLARGYQDPHFVEPKPSFILKLKKADVLVVSGRELEIGWLPPLIQQIGRAQV